ncbi:MAG: HD domain-containing protein [Nitrospirae bacterium]|nr:HD domain-containing protein [Nitrospirota bacterium]
MTRDDLDFFKNWFSHYCNSFYSANEEDNRNYSLKEKHIHNVCENIKEILAQSTEHRAQNTDLIAETIALFHDVGRFPQYAKYKTFNDSISVSHGLLGVETLIENKVLERLPTGEQDLILDSVKFHGVYQIPNLQESEKTFFLKLIRDADKLDIYRVFIEYYESPDEQRASATAFGLPDSPEYSKDVLSCVYKKQIPSYTGLKTLNDFRLMQLSWIYDLNFKATCRLLLDRGYINRIVSFLPQTEEIQNVITLVGEYIRQRLDGR